MHKIAVISDTHDHLTHLKKTLEIINSYSVDLIIHCGDWVSPFTLEYFDNEYHHLKLKSPVKSVLGNNEGDLKRLFERNSQLKSPIQFANKTVLEQTVPTGKIAIYHGQDSLITQALVKSGQYQAVFHGHTHQIRQEKVGHTYILNPGSIIPVSASLPANQSSLAIYSIETNSAEIIKF